jgi:hypothetical protein
VADDSGASRPNRPAEHDEDRFADLLNGLRNGDLLPLAEHLRAGSHIPDWIAAEIAEMIEGESYFFDIVAKSKARGKGRRRDQQGWTHWDSTRRKRHEIGVRLEKALREQGGDGCFESVVKAVSDEIGVGRTVVTDCHREAVQRIERSPPERRDDIWRMWFEAFSGT